jgi:hypothetical protein
LSRGGHGASRMHSCRQTHRTRTRTALVRGATGRADAALCCACTTERREAHRARSFAPPFTGRMRVTVMPTVIHLHAARRVLRGRSSRSAHGGSSAHARGGAAGTHEDRNAKFEHAHQSHACMHCYDVHGHQRHWLGSRWWSSAQQPLRRTKGCNTWGACAGALCTSHWWRLTVLRR